MGNVANPVWDVAKRELARMRASADAWQELRCEPVKDAEGRRHDPNAVRRALVLWGLQYDRRPDDLPLLRWLAGQEATYRRTVVGAGLSEETELAGFLLAEHRQVADVWLHWQIKLANFDTWGCYDRGYLFAAGVQETIRYVQESDHRLRGALLDYLLDEQGRPTMSEDELAEWWRHRRSYFPSDPSAEDPLTWVERAMLAGERDVARQWLDRWAAGRPRDESTVSVLSRHLADLGAYAEAAAARRESLKFAATDRDRASALRDLADLERQAGNHHAAWEALRECRRALDGVSGWHEIGLGRMYVEELFRLAASAEGDLARWVFTEADRQAGGVPHLPLVALQAAVEAAEWVGDDVRAAHYQELCAAEGRRIAEELERAHR